MTKAQDSHLQSVAFLDVTKNQFAQSNSELYETAYNYITSEIRRTTFEGKFTIEIPFGTNWDSEFKKDNPYFNAIWRRLEYDGYKVSWPYTLDHNFDRIVISW